MGAVPGGKGPASRPRSEAYYREDCAMYFYDDQALNAYLSHDSVAWAITHWSRPADPPLVCQQWLEHSSAKRLIFYHMYGDLLGLWGRLSEGQRVLDVGGGMTALTRALAGRHAYDLIDVMAHDSGEAVENMLGTLPRYVWLAEDWNAYEPDRTWDIIIANDLFPNVDQRLERFLNKYLPVCREMRLSLTTYDNGRFYRVRRTAGEEIMWMAAWDARQTREVMAPYRR